MKNLKFIIAHPQVKVQLCEEEKIVAEISIVSNRDLSKYLLETVDILLNEQNLLGTDVKKITVHEEIPSFSATRTAQITAQMLAESWRVVFKK